jgi:phospholipase/lecithinase/hemolysin
MRTHDSAGHTLRRLAATLALTAALALPAAAASPYSGYVVFGDSLSDVGNLFLGTGGAQPAAPYANGQFSNGPVWAQGLACNLGLAPLTPALSGGTDFAFGGAVTASPASIPFDVGVPNLNAQIGAFLSTVGGTAPSSALYSVWIGANDVLGILASADPAALSDTQSAAHSEAAAIGALASHGALNILVPLLPDLGKTPRLLAAGPLASLGATVLSTAYNSTLLTDLAGITGIPGLDITVLDTFSLIDTVAADPTSYGLSNTINACYIGPYTGGGTSCATPNDYLFWDSIHPSAIGHNLIANAASEALVPEPATTTLLLTSLLGLAYTRRRR